MGFLLSHKRLPALFEMASNLLIQVLHIQKLDFPLNSIISVEVSNGGHILMSGHKSQKTLKIHEKYEKISCVFHQYQHVQTVNYLLWK